MKKFVYRPAEIKEFVYSIVKNVVHKRSCVQFVIHKAICVQYYTKCCTQNTEYPLFVVLRSDYK